jgi:hypothetical protein
VLLFLATSACVATLSYSMAGDAVNHDLSNPQSFNRYSYVLNNPLAFSFGPNSATSLVMGQSGPVQEVLNSYYMTGQTSGLYTFGGLE